MCSGIQHEIKREIRITKAIIVFKHCFSVMIGNITVKLARRQMVL